MLSGAQPPFRIAGRRRRLAMGRGQSLAAEGQGDGRTIGTVTALRDVTARRAMEDELARRRAEAEAANHAKSNFPGHDEPRDPHAAQRRAGHGRGDGGRRTDAVSARAAGGDPRSPARSCSACSTTSSTSRRSRPASSSLEAVEFGVAQLCGSVVAAFAGAGRGQGRRAGARGRRGRARPLPRRSDPRAADSRQPGLQRPEVHRTRAGARARSSRRRAASALSVQRHRRRHRAEPADTAVREVRAGRLLHHPPLRRHGPRPRHLPRAGRADGRRHLGREPGRARAPPSLSSCRCALRRRRAAARQTSAAPRHDGRADAALRLLAAEDNEVNRLVLRTLLGQAGVDRRLSTTARRPSRPGRPSVWT